MQFPIATLMGFVAIASATVQVTIYQNEDCTGNTQVLTVGGDCIGTTPGFSSFIVTSTPATQDGIGILVQEDGCGNTGPSKTFPYNEVLNTCSGGFGFTANDLYQSQG